MCGNVGVLFFVVDLIVSVGLLVTCLRVVCLTLGCLFTLLDLVTV